MQDDIDEDETDERDDIDDAAPDEELLEWLDTCVNEDIDDTLLLGLTANTLESLDILDPVWFEHSVHDDNEDDDREDLDDIDDEGLEDELLEWLDMFAPTDESDECEELVTSGRGGRYLVIRNGLIWLLVYRNAVYYIY